MQGVHNNREEIERFIEDHISHKETCHIWGDIYTDAGYGTMFIGGAIFAVRRVVWWLKHGYLPQGNRMGDTCGKKMCCNPDHLTDNTAEEDRRPGLFRKGKSFNSPKVSQEKAAKIWEELMLGSLTFKAAAQKCGTSIKTLRKHIKRYEENLQSGL